MARKPISKRLRFEVFKRDGFRCRYCGTTPDVCVLHVDHVVPVSKGGTNDPANLVAACASCNGGKSDRSLNVQSIKVGMDKDDLAEQAEQLRGYLKSLKKLEEAREQILVAMAQLWVRQVGQMSQDMFTRLRSVLSTTPVEKVRYAIEAVGKSKLAAPHAAYDWPSALRQQKYFSGVLRALRAEQKGGAS